VSSQEDGGDVSFHDVPLIIVRVNRAGTLIDVLIARLPYPITNCDVEEEFATLERRRNTSEGIVIGEPRQPVLTVGNPGRPKPEPKHKDTDGESQLGAIRHQQRLLSSADDPEDTPIYNNVWLDSVCLAWEGSIEDAIEALICDTGGKIVNLTRDDNVGVDYSNGIVPSSIIKDELDNSN
jgi:hypothetical protein